MQSLSRESTHQLLCLEGVTVHSWSTRPEILQLGGNLGAEFSLVRLKEWYPAIPGPCHDAGSN